MTIIVVEGQSSLIAKKNIKQTKKSVEKGFQLISYYDLTFTRNQFVPQSIILHRRQLAKKISLTQLKQIYHFLNAQQLSFIIKQDNEGWVSSVQTSSGHEWVG